MSGQISATPGVSLTPTATMTALPTNYLTAADFDFASQYLPETEHNEFNRWGNQSVASVLRFFGAEKPVAADLIKWAENGRLHTQYRAVTTATADGQGTSVMDNGTGACTFRVNQTVVISSNTSGGEKGKAVISAVSGGTFTVKWYAAAGQPTGFQAATALTAYVYGSEFKKGSSGMSGSLEADTEIFENKTIIMKDLYEVAASDMAQITWVKGSVNDGDQEGFFWYLKSKSRTRQAFDDLIEMAMIEAVPAENGSAAEAYLSDNTGGGNAGTEGLFEAVGTGGNVWSGGYPTAMSEFDEGLIDRLDAQGGVSENLIMDDRRFQLAIDNMLASQNGVGIGGTSYGAFENSKDIALELGFSGFTRGGYEFYNGPWKYLNETTLQGGMISGKVRGLLIPVGSTDVYDQMLGDRSSNPYLHVRYRAGGGAQDRKYRSWLTGGEAGTDNIDKLQINFLSERALCVMGRNNFVLFED